jgi:hypothetical protein
MHAIRIKMKQYSFLIYFFLIGALLRCMDEPAKMSIFLPKDIIRQKVEPQLSLQDRSRFNGTCKTFTQTFDLENICPSLQVSCSTYTCARFRRCHYDVRTKVLAHYSETKNKVYDHLMQGEDSVRYAEESGILDSKISKRHHKYATTKKIHKQRLKQLVLAINNDEEQLLLLKHILKGSNFNIFDGGKKYRKRRVWLTDEHYTLRSLFSLICSYYDVDLLLVALGGIFEPRAFKYVFRYAEFGLIQNLLQKAIVHDIRDKQGKSIDDYMRYHTSPSARRRYERRGGGLG